ncbi:MAG TPA: MCP four helix bundle domain-containing protein [Clostridium sp.]|uniref:MCP four helix bundle domain-containing protein n=1 Tax=Clostridium sp. TaxID=1506 RepID=UPI002F92C600
MKWFNNLKMVQKLVLSFVLVSLFIGIVGFIGMYNMNSIDKNINNIYANDLIGVNAINNVKSNSIQGEKDFLQLLGLHG